MEGYLVVCTGGHAGAQALQTGQVLILIFLSYPYFEFSGPYLNKYIIGDISGFSLNTSSHAQIPLKTFFTISRADALTRLAPQSP